MGRGGGGGGGGSHSFGGSSGRSFGGSSSHSSRGGGSSSSRGGGAHYTYSSGPHISTHRHYHYGPSYGGGGYYGGGGWFITALVTIVTILMAFIIIGAIAGSSVTKSTVEREPLKPYAEFNTDCVDDDANWIHDRNSLLRGMESFYKATGVQPALAIYEEIDGEKYLRDSDIEDFMTGEYDKLIGHERGVLLLFCEYEESDWCAYYMAGEDAQTVMNSEASDILIDYVHDLYTNDSLSDEEFFGKVFEKTGERIMTVTPTVASKMPVIVIGIVIIAFIIGMVKLVKMKHRREKEKAEETERILKTPIDRI